LSIDYELKDRIATITINRPRKMNVVTLNDVHKLSRLFIDFRDDDNAWVLIITGAGNRAFCAGFDITGPIPDKFPPMITRGITIYKPIIAAINGVCMGGGLDLALACDLRVSSANATFADPGVKFGMMAGWGGTQRLPRIVKPSHAAKLLLIAETIDAKEAHRIGLLNAVVPQNDVMTTAAGWAKRICDLGPLAVRAAKKAMIEGTSVSLAEGLQIEQELFTRITASYDAKEGQQAFVEKRKPSYRAK
jgi:enoyl-CoA hydratase/carnithine racemase